MSNEEISIELAQTNNTLRALRPELLRLKPRYPKRGRPTKADWLAAGKPLTRAQWTNLWRREGPGWGGKRNGAGRKMPMGKRSVRLDFTINIEHAEKLDRLPKGRRSKYVNDALELMFMMNPPPEKRPPDCPPRGRHAHKPDGWKQTRPTRMTKIERARHNLELAKARLAEEELIRNSGTEGQSPEVRQ